MALAQRTRSPGNGGRPGTTRSHPIPSRPDPDPFVDPVSVALVSLIAERGYEAVEVEVIAERAGVTMEAFHRRFADKQAATVATIEACLRDFEWMVETVYASRADWREGLRACAWAIADHLEEHPDLVHVLMIDLLEAKNEMLRVLREETLMYGARVIDRARAAAPEPEAVPAGAAAIAIGSIAQLLTHRLQKGEELAAHATVRQMIYLSMRPYLGEETAREELSLPRPEGSHLERPAAEPHRHPVPPRPEPDPFVDPVTVAVIGLIDELGYEAVEVEAIAGRAGISSEEFAERFTDKQECVLASVEAYVADFEWTVETAYASGEGWREGLRASAYAVADYIDTHPTLLKVVLVDLLQAKNERLRVLREESLMYGARVIDRGRAEAADPRSVAPEAGALAMGSIGQLLTHRLQKGEDIAAHETAPQLLYLAVRPYFGDAAAREELRMPRPVGSYVRR
jgi:AcrR family transcriptional regulator